MKKPKSSPSHHPTPKSPPSPPPVDPGETPASEATEKPHFQVEEVPESTTPGDTYLDPEAFPDTQGLEADTSAKSDTIADSFQSEENPMSDFRPETFSPQTPAADQSLPQHDFRLRRQSPRPLPYWLVGGGIILIIAVGALARFVFFKPQPPEATPQVTDILIETIQPSPSPEAEEKQALKRENFKLQVLNGSGVVGAAGKLAQVLQQEGFKDIDTANADNYDYTGVTIRVKPDTEKLGELIESDLAADYEQIKVKTSLDEANDYDAVITLGSQPGDEEILGASDEVGAPTDKANSESTSSAQTD